MNMGIVDQFLTSPNWFRSILAVVLFVNAYRLPIRPPCFLAFTAIPLIYLFREIALFFVPAQVIVLAVEFLIIGIYLCWVCGYRNRRDGIIYFAITAPIVVVLTTLVLLQPTAAVWQVLHTMLVSVSFIYLMQQIYSVSTKNLRDGEFVEHMRGYFSLYYILVLMMEIFVSTSSFYYSAIIL